MEYHRGTVEWGPDLFADHEFRPFVRLSDETHPFSDEEALYAAVTSTERAAAVRLRARHFESGGPPRESYANPWTVVSIRHADVGEVEGRLATDVVDRIATETAGYLGLG